MRKIMKVSDFVSAPNRQFVALQNFYSGGESSITKVSRLKDGKEFGIIDTFFERNIVIENISLNEYIEITLFDDDMIHVYIKCHIHLKPFNYWASKTERIQINDIEAMVSFLREDVRDKYIKKQKIA